MHLGQCILLLPDGLSRSGGEREEAGLEDLRFLVELEEAIELQELLSKSTPETQVAIAAWVEAETELPRGDCFADSTPLGFNTFLQGAACSRANMWQGGQNKNL